MYQTDGKLYQTKWQATLASETNLSKISLPSSAPSFSVSSQVGEKLDSISPEDEPEMRVVTCGPSDSKRIALTFDDGPQPRLTAQVLEILRNRKVKATFFVLGKCVKQHPEILRQVAAEGHEIGNHTYDHRLLAGMSDEQIERQITETQAEIKSAIGEEPRIFRPPYGVLRVNSKAILADHHMNAVLWSVDPRDWRVRNRDKILHAVTNHVQNGSIVVCHDIYQTTVDALPEMIDALQAAGYELTTVSQLCGFSSPKLAAASKSF